MRRLGVSILFVLLGCQDDPKDACGPIPAECNDWAITYGSGDSDDCPDSKVCNCNPDVGHWEIYYCDEFPDDAGAPDAGLVDAAASNAGM